MRDPYKANIIRDEIQKSRQDDYYIVRLKGDSGKPINLDEGALRLLVDYFEGKIGG